MTRHELRERIFQTVFQFPFYSGRVPEFVYDSYEELTGEEHKYVNEKVNAIQDRLPEIDVEIDKHSNKWKIKRLGKSELAILRLAVYEIKFDGEVPEKVAINEAIELAKVYCDERSASFINGVLSGVVRS